MFGGKKMSEFFFFLFLFLKASVSLCLVRWRARRAKTNREILFFYWPTLSLIWDWNLSLIWDWNEE